MAVPHRDDSSAGALAKDRAAAGSGISYPQTFPQISPTGL